MSRWIAALSLVVWSAAGVHAQTAPVEGLHDNTPRVHALLNARIVVSPGNVIPDGTLVIRDGIIEAVGAEVAPPPDARLWDLSGSTLYAGFVELYSDLGMPEPPGGGRPSGPLAALAGRIPDDLLTFIASQVRTDSQPDRKGIPHWNPQVRSFVRAADELAPDEEKARKLRSQGFTVAVTVPRSGIFRGQSALVGLGTGRGNERVLASSVAQHLSFQRTASLGGDYPTSLMGAISLIRQTWLDAEWYRRAHEIYEANPRTARRPEKSSALEALGSAVGGGRPVVFEVTDEENFMRAVQIGHEFSLDLWIRGSGHEYRILDAIGGADIPVIVPVNFPDAPSLEGTESALEVSLAELRHWDAAPENPGRLAKARIPFALTSDRLAAPDRFLTQVRRAVSRGLSPDQALAALTTQPASWLGMDDRLGTLEAGKVANVVVSSGEIFADDAAVREVWIDGDRFEIDAPPAVDPRGVWSVSVTGEPEPAATVTLKGTPARLSGEIETAGGKVELDSVQFAPVSRRLTFRFKGDSLEMTGIVLVSATVGRDEIVGTGFLPDGREIGWRGIRSADHVDAGEERSREVKMASFPDITPPMEYGRESPPEQPPHVLVRNATIWTQGPGGRLENADLLVRRGKVVEVGRNLSAPADAAVVDASGKHVAPGLIDPHLHSGIAGGVNEMGAAIVPEVRIGDVITHSIWMYRQLAGGLTTANLKHGSANPIGGQNAVVKLRWGRSPDDYFLEGAPRTVKFALGENVKRRSGRYPDTRMGTEQIIRDHFKAARDYERARALRDDGGGGLPPRRDLRMEALVDILNGDIAIHAHCYRQDEILMLMRVAEDFGIRVKSFHHTVEAFKIADELARHGAAAVVWSDWGGFKVEAYDGILYNARLASDQGVLTSLHSDDGQIATRMNWEAAKMLRTGMEEEAALGLVTLNPARVLGIDSRVGSLEPGKDADFVIWSGHPLSTFSVAEQTWIDGARYFDLEEDLRLRERVHRERTALIQKALQAPAEGGPSGRPGRSEGRPMPTDDDYLFRSYDADYSCMEEHHHDR